MNRILGQFPCASHRLDVRNIEGPPELHRDYLQDIVLSTVSTQSEEVIIRLARLDHTLCLSSPHRNI